MSKVVKGAELKAKQDIEQFKTESNEVIKNLKNENAATEKQFEDFKKDSEKTIQDKFLMDQLLMHPVFVQSMAQVKWYYRLVQ